jgi:TolB protein
MMNPRRLVRLAILLLSAFAATAQAALNITITQGAIGATPIGIVPFAWHGQTPQPPQKVGEIVANDLRRSGLFAPLPPAKMPQRPTQPGNIQFNAWSQVGVSDVVIGGVEETSPGQYSVRFQLFDTLQGQQLMGYTIRATKVQLRRAAHRISDLIYQELTGQRGAFDTHIAYVSTEVKNGHIVRYRIMVADADGYNPHVVYSSPKPLSMPTWSPDGKYLAYVSFEAGHPQVYLQNLATAKRELISNRPGLNSAPAFSPDGRKLALTLSRHGDAEIFIMDLATKKLTQFTHDASINTGAAWMPDGKSIVFTSDRGGSPQLYVKSLDGGSAQRLTFDGNYNAAPAVSPDGGKIAFVHSDQGAFRIALLNLNSGQMQVVTKGQLDESPSFAPNGSMVIYSTDYQGRSVLSAVSVDGRVRQRLSGPENVSQPAWSPFGDQPAQ